MLLSELEGVGKARLEALNATGIFSLRDLLYTVPTQYKDTSRVSTVAQAAGSDKVSLLLKRVGEAKLTRHGRLTRVSCDFTDDTGHVTACWFNQPWMREGLNRRVIVMLYGAVERSGSARRMTNPSLETETRIIPIYRPIEGLPQRTHIAIALQALPYAETECPETLPDSLLSRLNLMPRADALRALHAPESLEAIEHARRRIAFEQMLLYQAAVRMVKDERRHSEPIPSGDEAIEAFWRLTPFKPTLAQWRTLDEIARDMRRDRAMARMVQGDVGSGKTAVAMGAMLLCAKAGMQAAMMAPTEILARQHAEGMKPFFEKLGIGCGLLVGGMPARERREALQNIADGSWQIIIGTHALIAKNVAYKRLGLCVTDEQHRFGVAQRTALLSKGDDGTRAPHLLVMSATPIPRSLALILFGDLDLSLIDELPPGRLPVTTRIVPEEKREAMYGFIRRELDAGRQAYIVCPLVEESEDDDGLKAAKAHAKALAEDELKDRVVGLTYGNQPAEEKRETLRRFVKGDMQVLVATTVIEVGVNVPNASLMIIEDADQYGLAQLHQLRGRVGRGTAQSWCFLLAKPNERLRALVSTNDGFEVARRDLELRGPGELLGTRQHGEAGFGAALGSTQLLYEAAQCAEELQSNPTLAAEWETIKEQAQQTLARASERVSIS